MSLVRASATPTITAAHYSVGDAIGSQMQFNVAANKGLIYGCRVLNKMAQKTPLELWLFRASTTGGGLDDNQPFAPSDTQLADLAGVVRIDQWFATSENSIGQSSELPFSFNDLSGGLFYGWLVSRGEPTFASTSDLTVQIETDQAASSINRRKRVYYWPRRNPRIPFDVGDAVGTQFTFNAGSNAGTIVGCRVLDKGRQSAPAELWLFKASTTGPGLANNEPFAPSDTQLENAVGVIRVSDWYVTERNSVGQAENLSFQFGGLTDGQLYGWLVTRGTPAYARNDLSVQLQFERAASSVNRRRRVYYRPRQYPPLSTLTITPTENYHTIHLKFNLTPPANLPPSTPRVTGSYLHNGRWVEFHPALLDDAGANTLYTILFGLQENTTYPVKMEFSRTNNATGALIERKAYHRTYTTRKSPRPANTVTRYVAPTGINSGAADGSYANPYKTIPFAIANPAAIGTGGTIILKNGTYSSADYGLLTGVAAAGGASTITLGSEARAIDSFYNGWTVTILSGAGSGESKSISAYVGSTKVATVSSAWTTQPNSTSVYRISKADLQFEGTAWTVADFDGTSGAYNLIRAETAGQVIISGKKPMTTASGLGSWSADSAADVYYADFSAFMDTTLKSAPRFVRKESKTATITSSADNGGKVRLTVASGHGLSQGDRITISGHSVTEYNVSARIVAVGSTTLDTDILYTSAGGATGTWTSAHRHLYHYYSLELATVPPDWPAIRSGTREGHLIDWTNNRIYVRVPAGTGAPADGRYSAGWHRGQALDFVSCDYLIVEGLTFEMFGSIARLGGSTASGNVGASTSNSSTKVRFHVGAGHDLSRGSRITISGHTPNTYDGTANVTAAPLVENITSSANNGSGKVRFTVPTGHALVAGDTITISDHSTLAFNTTTVLSAVTATTLDTDINYGSGPNGTGGIWTNYEKVDTDIGYTTAGSGGTWTLAGHYHSAALTAAAKGGLRIYAGGNVVVRGCTFNQANLSMNVFNGNAPSIVTVEDCAFAGHDWWTQLYHDPFDAENWELIKNTTNEIFTLLAQVGTPQLVVRRCAFTGCDNGLSLNTTAGNNDCDIYQNRFTNLLDGAIEFNSPDVVCKNGAIWANTFAHCLNAIRFSELTNGPMWIIANDGRDDCGYFFAAYTSGGAGNDGWKLFYHNTFITETTLLVPPDASCLSHGSGMGRVVAVNNIYQAPGHYVSDTGSAAYPATNTYTKNAIYSTAAAPKWLFNSVPKDNEGDFLTAAGSAMSFSGNIYTTDPYPSGITGPLAAGLVGIAVRIVGITDIAADANGQPLAEPLSLGYFPRWRE